MQLKDQAAIVTGGASGLGAATARRLAAQGARGAVCGLNPHPAEAAAAGDGGLAAGAAGAPPAPPAEPRAEAPMQKAGGAGGRARVLVIPAAAGAPRRVTGKK